jgi:hypothetical protein
MCDPPHSIMFEGGDLLGSAGAVRPTRPLEVLRPDERGLKMKFLIGTFLFVILAFAAMTFFIVPWLYWVL